MKLSQTAWLSIILIAVAFFPALGYCSVETTLSAVQSKLVNVLMPAAGILGLCFAAFSFFSGNPGARQHLWLAIIGACVGFGSSSIMTFIRTLVN